MIQRRRTCAVAIAAASLLLGAYGRAVAAIPDGAGGVVIGSHPGGDGSADGLFVFLMAWGACGLVLAVIGRPHGIAGKALKLAARILFFTPFVLLAVMLTLHLVSVVGVLGPAESEGVDPPAVQAIVSAVFKAAPFIDLALFVIGFAHIARKGRG